MAAASAPASTALTDEQRRSLLRPVSLPSRLTTLTLLLLGALFVWSVIGTEINPQKLQRGIPNIIRFVGSLWPPDGAYWTQMLEPIVATLQMAIVGTIVSVVLAFPFALLAARNTSPNALVYQLSRFFLNVVRAIPPLVWAIIFVAALGFGPFAGVVALGIGGLGVLGKLYSEAIEAIRATGSGGIQVFSFAVLPPALPLMVSYTLLDFEANVRSATILGIVGAGGIGFELQASFSQFKFHEVLTILLEIVIMVTVIDRLSSFVRNRLI